MATFLLVTHGTAGDVLPFIRIGACLAARGHDVTLWTHAPYEDRARRAGFGFEAVDGASGYRKGLESSGELLAARGPDDLRRYYERTGLFEQMRREVAGLVSRHRSGQTVLVGRHTSALSVLVAAELVDAPTAWVAVAPTQLAVAPAAALNVARGLSDGINAVRAGFGLPGVTNWGRWLRSAHCTIGLWPDWFDTAGKPAPSGVRLTGFVTGDEDGGFPESEPVPVRILVTGGTGQLLHPRFYPVAVAAVASLDEPAIVVAPRRDLLPDRLPDKLSWYPELSFPAFLPNVAALLHHGGIGTAVRALRSGTPQVIMAYGADRPDNAERLAAHGMAKWTAPEDWRPETIAGQLKEAIVDGRRTPLDEPESAGPDRATRLLERLVLLRRVKAAPD